MKVDSKHIVELFTEIKCLLDSIADIIQMGDDGMEDYILSTAKDIRTVINVFSIDHMTPIIKPDKEPAFLKRHVELNDKSQQPGVGLEPYENVLLFKARFYLFLRRELLKIDLQAFQNHNLHNDIFNEVVFDSRYYSYFSTDFERPGYAVIELVANEIIEHRRKHPQLAMSFDKPLQEVSKALINKIY
jgi:hypothetical protein